MTVEESGESRHELSKMDKTCLELREIARKSKKNKKYLQVLITDIHKVTYMYIRTDHRCFISPYIYSVSNSAGSFLLELKTNIDYSNALSGILRKC